MKRLMRCSADGRWDIVQQWEGHHAYRDLASGFCFLNNSAVAAAHLRLRHERVAILDVDVAVLAGFEEVR